jgi:hypothetical protein
MCLEEETHNELGDVNEQTPGYPRVTCKVRI